MDKKELLDLRMDISNILDVCVKTAKHRIGEISDEEYKQRINDIEEMLEETQRRVALDALGQLIDMVGKKAEE